MLFDFIGRKIFFVIPSYDKLNECRVALAGFRYADRTLSPRAASAPLKRGDQLARPGMVAMFAKVNSLPGAQRHTALANRQ